MEAYLSDKGKTVLPELISAVIEIPEDTRRYFLGYAQALIDFGIGKDGANRGQKQS